ncbi:HAD-IA family hydrolase [Salinarimonas ramus]|uniref:Haloacid dehalogenase n=1 Tax=Salinarimonas ramus TaxID=690164 RepID=A0A917V8V6_9HYPH|nr:HAD-IA family hydrolase [Salinarimonas ramus]GGK50490.1 haloacid dehalogenase [Salinarimonas ramus]
MTRAPADGLRLVLLDLDGTLVDSQAIIVEAQVRTFRAHGLPPPTRERSLSIVGLSLPEAFRVLAGEDGPWEAMAQTYREVFSELRAEGTHEEPLYPGVRETIAALARREEVLLGIATGKSRRGVTHLVARESWEGLFATIQTADDAPSKPHPGMILQALSETGVAPPSAAMVGDSTFDMDMARAAGVAGIGVSYGFHGAGALRDRGAHTIVDRFSEIVPVLDRLWRA